MDRESTTTNFCGGGGGGYSSSAEGEECRHQLHFVCFTVAIVCVATAITLLWVLAFPISGATYSVAIDSVSGLDNPAAALNPEFNLTLRVSSKSYGSRGCVGPRAYLEVSYRCTRLAMTETSPEKLCAGPRKSAERQVVARGTGVRLPGYLVDSLMADARRGVAAVFEVTLRRHNDEYDGGMMTEGCGLRRVGDAASAIHGGGSCIWWSMPTCNNDDGAAAGWDNSKDRELKLPFV